MDPTHLDWSTAEVRDGTLTVALEAKPPRAWAASFVNAARLLNHGRFSDVTLKRGTVRIEPVHPGDEEVVRHFLESLVQEADAHLEAEEDPAPQPAAGEASEAPDGDGAMTEAFRGFAPAEAADEGQSRGGGRGA